MGLVIDSKIEIRKKSVEEKCVQKTPENMLYRVFNKILFRKKKPTSKKLNATNKIITQKSNKMH